MSGETKSGEPNLGRDDEPEIWFGSLLSALNLSAFFALEIQAVR